MRGREGGPGKVSGIPFALGLPGRPAAFEEYKGADVVPGVPSSSHLSRPSFQGYLRKGSGDEV